MSRFSFRVWDENSKHYKFSYPCLLNGSGHLLYQIDGKLIEADTVDHSLIIEQSTGHLAYQKLEMLEGDIVRCMEDNLIFEIAWRGCGLVAICKAPGTNNDGMIRDIPDWSWEIIGNVHEEGNK